jgi:predicted ATPase
MEAIDIVSIHEKLLRFLLDWKRKHAGFTFSLRKSDISKRLSAGYWFHGNDEYISISFWTGLDWQSKVPNISFVIIPITGECYVQFSAKDSEEKDNLIHSLFYEKLKLNEINRAFYSAPVKFSTGGKYIDELEHFLQFDKEEIDTIIKTNKELFETKQNSKNRIGLITEEEFQRNFKKTQKFRARKVSTNLPISLSSIDIKDYGLIKNGLSIGQLPPNAQWIFFTGENGSGKTTILRAFATAITNGSLKLTPKNHVNGNYAIELILNKHDKVSKHLVKRRAKSKEFEILTKGFVAFGPVRLNVQEPFFSSSDKRRGTLKHMLSRPYIQLFSTISPLIDIGFVYNRNQEISKELKNDQEKLRYIIEAITTICDSIVDIHFGKGMRYFESDKNQKLISGSGGTQFQNLASGYKSIIAMVSHMMLHLYQQQPNVDDPSALEGVVIIDEIDLHFHPRMQRDLVIKLSEIFPRIQFIASTHSPIPLLGVPSNTPIFTVKKDYENGIYVERMDDEVEIKDLLPNSILTSPIFGFQEIYSDSRDSNTFIRPETTFEEVLENDSQKERIGKFLNKRNASELLKLLKE